MSKPKAVTIPPLRRWSITKAMAEAARENIKLSRPTVIMLCRRYGVGYQPAGKRGWWIVEGDKFMKLIKGEFEI